MPTPPSPSAAKTQAEVTQLQGLKLAARAVTVMPIYILYVAVAELSMSLFNPVFGLVLYTLMLIVLLLHAAAVRNYPLHKFLICLAYIPVSKLLSYSLPLAGFPLLYWYLILSIPLMGTLVVIRFILHYHWYEIGFHVESEFLQLFIGLSGVVLGYVQYQIIKPRPLVPSFTLPNVVIAVIVMLLCTGALEEMIFRGLLQWSAAEAGRRFGIICVSLIYTTLFLNQAVTQNIWLLLPFVFLTSFLFSWLTAKTQGTLGVALAHGLLNLTCFIILPLVIR